MTSGNAPKSGDISLSVEETNRHRIALGLRPLRTNNASSSAKTPSQPSEMRQQQPHSQAKAKQPDNHVTARLEQSRLERRTREATMAPLPVSPHRRHEQPSDASAREDELAAWVDRSRSLQDRKPSAARRSRRGANDAKPSGYKPQRQPPQSSPPPSSTWKELSVPDDVEEGAILTLRDSSVLHPRRNERPRQAPLSITQQSDSDSDSDADDAAQADMLETAVQNDGGSDTRKLPTDGTPHIAAHYDPTDNAEFLPNARKRLQRKPDDGKSEPAVHSLAPTTAAKVIESDYHGATEPNVTFRKRREKRSRKKRVRSHVASPPAVESDKLVDTVSRGHVKALRKAADRDSGEEDDDDEDAHYTAMLKARRKSEESSVQKRVHALLDAIKRTNAQGNDNHDGDGGGDGDGDGADGPSERGARILYDDMQAFLQRVPVPLPAASSVAMQKNHDDTTDSDVIARGNGGDVAAAATGDSKAAVTSHVEKVDKVDGTASGTAEEVGKKQADTTDEPERPMGLTGVAATLKRLREMGQLTKKKEKTGRPGDRRFNAANESDGEGDVSIKQKTDVKLSYVDDFGNELTPKEAFRLLCHKFHGNGPGKNKNEKRLKKVLEGMRVRNMQTGDTPLSSVAALKEETKKKRSAHVVLSGPEAFQAALPAADGQDEQQQLRNQSPSQTRAGDGDKVNGKRTMEEKIEFTIGGSGVNPAKRRRR